MYFGCVGTAPRILSLGNRWKWVVSFHRRGSIPQSVSPWYQLDRRLCGPQRRAERGYEKRKSHHCPCQELEPGRPARSLVYTDWAIPAPLISSTCLQTKYILHGTYPTRLWWKPGTRNSCYICTSYWVLHISSFLSLFFAFPRTFCRRSNLILSHLGQKRCTADKSGGKQHRRKSYEQKAINICVD
jgi:hypothetical protein